MVSELRGSPEAEDGSLAEAMLQVVSVGRCQSRAIRTAYFKSVELACVCSSCFGCGGRLWCCSRYGVRKVSVRVVG